MRPLNAIRDSRYVMCEEKNNGMDNLRTRFSSWYMILFRTRYLY